MQERIVSSKSKPEDATLDNSLRPKRLADYIGQEKVKGNLSIAIAAAKKRKEPLDHVLLYGPPGLGKTTLGHIVAAEMGVNLRITAGPAIERDGDLGIITAAHCSTTQWGTDQVVYHQPTSPGNRIGIESIDPVGFTNAQNSRCPNTPGLKCRWSDGSFITLDGGIPAPLGRIAKPEGTTLDISHATPKFRIVAEASFPVTGEFLYMVGHVSGLEGGSVSATCQDITLIEDPSRTYLCQDQAAYASVIGDSGAPVFKWPGGNDDVQLKGMHVGRHGGLAFFSYVGQIYLDLVQTATWNSCDPAFFC